MHALKELDLGHGVGCLVRYVAQTDWGKDTGEDGEVTDPSDPTTITLDAFETACKKGKKGDGEDGDRGKPDHAGQGKPPWAGPDGDKSLKPGTGPKNND